MQFASNYIGAPHFLTSNFLTFEGQIRAETGKGHKQGAPVFSNVKNGYKQTRHEGFYGLCMHGSFVVSDSFSVKLVFATDLVCLRAEFCMIDHKWVCDENSFGSFCLLQEY